jgi:uncharacterized membrane protein
MLMLREPWRTRLLWLSVAGNLFSATLIGTHLATDRGPGPPGLAGAAERMARDLPTADAARFRATLDRERPWYEIARRRMAEARADMARSIGQNPYDEAAVRERMLIFQARWAETSGRFGESLLTAIGTLSPEGRAKLAETAQASGPR